MNIIQTLTDLTAIGILNAYLQAEQKAGNQLGTENMKRAREAAIRTALSLSAIGFIFNPEAIDAVAKQLNETRFDEFTENRRRRIEG